MEFYEEEIGPAQKYELCNSMALQVVFSYFEQIDKIRMQILNRRFYNSFCPALVNDTFFYQMGNISCGLMVFP